MLTYLDFAEKGIPDITFDIPGLPGFSPLVKGRDPFFYQLTILARWNLKAIL